MTLRGYALSVMLRYSEASCRFTLTTRSFGVPQDDRWPNQQRLLTQVHLGPQGHFHCRTPFANTSSIDHPRRLMANTERTVLGGILGLVLDRTAAAIDRVAI